MRSTSTALYARLPEYLKRVDSEQGGPLRSLLAAAEAQADIVYDDIRRLWDNYFVETCAPWVLPYLADLIALNLLSDDPAANRRELARTIAYRRRKGTPVQLETLAADLLGCSCRVVEFFQRLHWQQYLQHRRPDCRVTVDLRSRAELARLGTASETASRLADFRPASARQGWHNVHKIGFFIWRLAAIPLRRVAARPVSAVPGGYHFDVLGQPQPLFQSPDVPEPPTGRDWLRREEGDVIGPLSPVLFAESQQRHAADPQINPTCLGASSAGLRLWVNGQLVPGHRIVAAELCGWAEPPPDTVAVDVRRGRLRFGAFLRPAVTDEVESDHWVGRIGALGGGGYERPVVDSDEPATEVDLITVARGAAVQTLTAALTLLSSSTRSLRVVEIRDSRTYRETLELPARFETLVIQARSGERPLLDLNQGHTAFRAPPGGVQGKRLVLRGLLISGTRQTLFIPPGIAELVIEDCTLDPGGGLGEDAVSLRPPGVTLEVAAPAVGVTVEIRRSLTGPLRIPSGAESLTIADSILDGQAHGGEVLAGGPSLSLFRTTLLGDAACDRLTASEALVTGRMLVQFCQDGCVRFSYFGPGSQVPVGYRPAPAQPGPRFTSTSFGHPAYAQLAADCPETIVRGGETEREIGVGNSRADGRRLEHLRLRLSEYLPAGLTPVFIFVT